VSCWCWLRHVLQGLQLLLELQQTRLSSLSQLLVAACLHWQRSEHESCRCCRWCTTTASAARSPLTAEEGTHQTCRGARWTTLRCSGDCATAPAGRQRVRSLSDHNSSSGRPRQLRKPGAWPSQLGCMRYLKGTACASMRPLLRLLLHSLPRQR
jgi:hypothetical protein